MRKLFIADCSKNKVTKKVVTMVVVRQETGTAERLIITEARKLRFYKVGCWICVDIDEGDKVLRVSEDAFGRFVSSLLMICVDLDLGGSFINRILENFMVIGAWTDLKR